MNTRAKEIVSNLTLEEKAALSMGKGFWNLVSVERLGLSEVMVSDGPHGLRKQAETGDHIGLNKSVPTTCFPTASASASSWDIDLLNEMGKAMGKECKHEKVSVILGPGANIKRSPLCGRNFEYISEDPYLTGQMASALVDGIQSQGIGTSLKHYAMNNQERLRMSVDAVVDERAQREIYLAGFEKCVKQSQPWTVMCSYNKVNGTYLSENKRLLTDILRDEWGYKGLVVTDWGAINKRDQGIKAGLDLEMPESNIKNTRVIIQAVKDKTLSIKELDATVTRVVELILKSNEAKEDNYKYDAKEHHKLAKKIAENSAVLLKNENILPLKQDSDFALIGEFTKKPRYQGAGSSLINPTKLDNACALLDAKGVKYEYAQGYSVLEGEANDKLIVQAAQVAKAHKYAIVFVGLTDEYESEGFDRENLNIPKSHAKLIEAVSEVNKNVIVVLLNGSPVLMQWIGKVGAVLECYLHGQAGAGAVLDILFGSVNPSGKLAETFPINLKDNPSYKYFPGYTRSVEYRESIYVGYRYYDKANKKVLFPFGYGLSYTDFEYSDIKVEKSSELVYKVSFTVKNIGEYDGAEIAQLYIKNNESPIFKAVKELKGFKKVNLKKGETTEITMYLDKRSFAYYNVNIKDWHVDSGEYGILVGASSADIRLEKQITILNDDNIEVPNYKKALSCYYKLDDGEFSIKEKDFEILLGRKLPPRQRGKDEPYDLESTLEDIKDTFVGKQFNKLIMKGLKNMLPEGTDANENSTYLMMLSIVGEMPLRSLAMLSDGRLPLYAPEAIVAMANKKMLRGIKLFMKK